MCCVDIDMDSMTDREYVERIAAAHGPTGITVTPEGNLVYGAYRDGGYELVSDNDGVLTDSAGDLTNPEWLSQRGTILALHDEGGAEQHNLVMVDPETGAVTSLTDTEQDDIKPLQNPVDPGQIAFISTRAQSLDLYTIRIDETDATPVKRSETEKPVWGFDWGPDGQRLVYQSGLIEDAALRVIDIDAGTDDMLVNEPDSEQTMAGNGHHAWSSDGIIFSTNHKTGYLELAVADADGTVEIIHETETDKYGARWLPDERVVYLAAEQGDYALRIYDDGDIETIEQAGLNSELTVSDGALYYKHIDTGTIGDIHRDGELVVTEGRVTLPTVAPEKLQYESFDGTEIPALLFTPADREAKAAVVRAHGGPESQHFNRLHPIDQTLVRNGYAILAPDVRGSIGYGREFRKASDGDLGGDDLQDLVAGGQYLRENGYDRVGLTGGSYGGYMTLMGVGATDTFDAGAAVCGVVNWETVVEDARGFIGNELMRKLGGTPDERPDFYVERSPITYADEIDVPLLVVQGANDPRVPQSEAEQIIDSLADRDIPYEYLLFEDEGHGVRLTQNRVEYINRVVSFFEEYL